MTSAALGVLLLVLLAMDEPAHMARPVSTGRFAAIPVVGMATAGSGVLFEGGDRVVLDVVHDRHVLIGAAKFHDHVAGYRYVAGAVPVKLQPSMVPGATTVSAVDVVEAAPVLLVVQAGRKLNALPTANNCNSVPTKPMVSGDDGADR